MQGAVEDLTGRGLQDLRAGLIRTPLPPQETFLDGAPSRPGRGLALAPRAARGGSGGRPSLARVVLLPHRV